MEHQSLRRPRVIVSKLAGKWIGLVQLLHPSRFPTFEIITLLAVLMHTSDTFYFASADNRNTFLGNVEKYTPEFGGYCTFGISAEPQWTSADSLGPNAYVAGNAISAWVDPETKKFYFFGGDGVKNRFIQDSTALLTAGNRRWVQDLDDPAVLNTNMVHWDADAPSPPNFTFVSLLNIFGKDGTVAYRRKNCSSADSE